MTDIKPSKKEVINVAEALNEENEKLIGRIKSLEAEVRGLKKVESWKYKAWKEIKWWYKMNLEDAVIQIVRASACILGGGYVVYKLGMEFAPALMGPLSNIVGRVITALLPF